MEPEIPSGSVIGIYKSVGHCSDCKKGTYSAKKDTEPCRNCKSASCFDHQVVKGSCPINKVDTSYCTDECEDGYVMNWNTTACEAVNATINTTQNNTERPPPNSTERPPPNSTESPPLDSTDKPLRNNTESPPPNTTDKPLPNNSERPPPNSTNRPLFNNTESPPPNTTDKPLPNSSERNPPNNTDRPLFNNTKRPLQNNTNKPSLFRNSTEKVEEKKSDDEIFGLIARIFIGVIIIVVIIISLLCVFGVFNPRKVKTNSKGDCFIYMYLKFNYINYVV